MTTPVKPTVTLNASTLTHDWEDLCLGRLMNEAFWTAVDDFVDETFEDFSDEERERIHDFLSGKTQVIVKSRPIEFD